MAKRCPDNGLLKKNAAPIFHTADDCIAIKSGKDVDGRAVGIPTNNVTVSVRPGLQKDAALEMLHVVTPARLSGIPLADP